MLKFCRYVSSLCKLLSGAVSLRSWVVLAVPSFWLAPCRPESFELAVLSDFLTDQVSQKAHVSVVLAHVGLVSPAGVLSYCFGLWVSTGEHPAVYRVGLLCVGLRRNKAKWDSSECLDLAFNRHYHLSNTCALSKAWHCFSIIFKMVEESV